MFVIKKAKSLTPSRRLKDEELSKGMFSKYKSLGFLTGSRRFGSQVASALPQDDEEEEEEEEEDIPDMVRKEVNH